MAQYTIVDDGTGNSTTMIQAEFSTKGKQSFQKWELCSICGFSYPVSKLTKIKGAYYCNQYRHYLDA